jgi:hypothetical protein
MCANIFVLDSLLSHSVYSLYSKVKESTSKRNKLYFLLNQICLTVVYKWRWIFFVLNYPWIFNGNQKFFKGQSHEILYLMFFHWFHISRNTWLVGSNIRLQTCSPGFESGNIHSLHWTACPWMGCHLRWYFTVGCPLRGTNTKKSFWFTKNK